MSAIKLADSGQESLRPLSLMRPAGVRSTPNFSRSRGTPQNLVESMTSNSRCSMPRLSVLAIVTSLLSGCATAGSEPRVVAVCPPQVDYNREFQARAAEELALLPERSGIAELLADYSVIRDQTRACVAKDPGRRSVTYRFIPKVLQP